MLILLFIKNDFKFIQNDVCQVEDPEDTLA